MIADKTQQRSPKKTTNDCFDCSFWRRLGAVIYDLLVVAAILMLAALPVILLLRAAVEPGTLWFQLYLTLVAGTYFVWSWRRGGQTLGMRAWRIHIYDQQGQTPSLAQCVSRYLFAGLSWLAFGIGWLWALGDHQSRTWHDLFSRTRLYHQP